MDERDIARILQEDFSAKTEAFRDALLERCLKAMESASEIEVRVLGDDELGLLSAAGAVFQSRLEGEGQMN